MPRKKHLPNPFKQWFDEQEKKGLSQSKLAEELGVPHQTVWNWLHDKTKPAGNVLQKIHDRTRIPASTLIQWAAGHDDGL